MKKPKEREFNKILREFDAPLEDLYKEVEAGLAEDIHVRVAEKAYLLVLEARREFDQKLKQQRKELLKKEYFRIVLDSSKMTLKERIDVCRYVMFGKKVVTVKKIIETRE